MLRSILRSDPDVIMVGEIRDVETAKISIEAALTGHFVLSTLHTNDAPAALTRLSEMGVEPFLTASAVSAVLAQRLMRKLCSSCSEPYQPTDEELLAARIAREDLDRFREGEFRRKVGCARCGNTGYKGRIGVFQCSRCRETIASLAATRASKDEIDESAASEEGMQTLWADGHREGRRRAHHRRRARPRRLVAPRSTHVSLIPGDPGGEITHSGLTPGPGACR